MRLVFINVPKVPQGETVIAMQSMLSEAARNAIVATFDDHEQPIGYRGYTRPGAQSRHPGES